MEGHNYKITIHNRICGRQFKNADFGAHLSKQALKMPTQCSDSEKTESAPGSGLTFIVFCFSSKPKETTGFFLLTELPKSDEEGESKVEEECLAFNGLQ